MVGMTTVPLSGDSIRLGQLLKLAGIAQSGADARLLLADGTVRVDGEVEQRRGRQLRRGDVVEVQLPRGVERIEVA
jgi:ribosome-associated protein